MAIGGLLACFATWLSRRKHGLAIPVLACIALLAALIPLVQHAFGLVQFMGDAVLASLYMLGFALALIAGCNATAVWGSARSHEAFAWVVLVGALMSAWLSLYQWQDLDYFGLYVSRLSVGMRPFANLNQPNHLATLLVLGLIATACLYDARRIGTVGRLALVALFGFTHAATGSRTGLLEIAIVGVMLLWLRERLMRRLRFRSALTAIVIVMALQLAWVSLREASVQPAGRETAEMMSAGTRAPHWVSMLDSIGRRHWLGYGWGQGAAAQRDVSIDHPPATELFDYGHNLVLDLLLWNGVPLGMLLVGVFAAWFIAALRRASDSTTLLALASVVALFVHSMLEYPLYYSYFLIPVGLLMGGISAMAMPRAIVKTPSWFGLSLIAAAGSLLILVTHDYLGIAEDIEALRFERARIRLDLPAHTLSNPYLLTHLGAYTRFARKPEAPGMSAAELDAMEAVVQRFPSGPNTVRYAAALAVNERPKQAAEALRPVCRMVEAQGCASMKSLWLALGKRAPMIGAVPWPLE